MTSAAPPICHATLAAGSKSFSLASRLLPRVAGDRAAVLYTWCRRADDAIDLVPVDEAPAQLARLRAELAACYRGEVSADPALAAFTAVVREVELPEVYPATLLDGLALDARGTACTTLDELHRYCFCVAGVVGLMMCHVFGVRDDAALRRAVHLGMAMQLTNVCRDVAEDWGRGRLYLPDELLAAAGAPDLRARLGEPVAAIPRAAVARVVEQLLAHARALYASGDAGIAALPWRAGLAVRAARRIYARIGDELARAGFDPLAGRAIVPPWRKRVLVLRALARQLAALPLLGARRLALRLPPPALPRAVLEYPRDVIPL